MKGEEQITVQANNYQPITLMFRNYYFNHEEYLKTHAKPMCHWNLRPTLKPEKENEQNKASYHPREPQWSEKSKVGGSWKPPK